MLTPVRGAPKAPPLETDFLNVNTLAFLIHN